MTSSLDSLTNNLVESGRKLTGFEDYSELQHDLREMEFIHILKLSPAEINSRNPNFLQQNLSIVI